MTSWIRRPRLVGVGVVALVAMLTPARGLGEVLWDQPVGSSVAAYANQDFETALDAFDIYVADDFTNAKPWRVESLFVPGGGFNGFTSLATATMLHVAIYADAGGFPDGDPTGAGTPPVWSLAVPPSDPQVVLSNGAGGLPSDVTLTLLVPVELPPGTWWLVFYPSLDYGTGGQHGRQLAETTNGAPAQVMNPGGGFTGFPAAWDDAGRSYGFEEHDFAFRIEGAETAVFGVGPDRGLYAGGTEVVITGYGFLDGATVTFGGVPATNVVYVDAQTLHATTPEHWAGPVDVTVTNPDLSTATLPNGFVYYYPLACPFTVHGEITAVDEVQTGRIFRDTTASTCAAPKTWPGFNDTTEPYFYDTYLFWNRQPSAQCVTVTVTADATSTDIHGVGYLNGYDPTAQDANYLGDTGLSSSSSTARTMSFSVPAGGTLVVVVVDANSGETGGYSLGVTGCGAISAPSTTTVVSAPNPSVTGEPVTLTAHVAATSGTPYGAVSFWADGSQQLGTAALDNSGDAVLEVTPPGVGSYQLHAEYAGGPSHLPSVSEAITHEVTKASSGTTVISTSNPSIFGARVVFFATVTPVAPGAGIPTGSVTWKVGDTVLEVRPLDANGRASYWTEALPAGTTTVTADYAGDDSYLGSTGTFDQVVTTDGVMVTLESSSRTPVYGDDIAFTATVVSNLGLGVPTGTVGFSEGGTTLGFSPMAGGVASLVVAGLGAGAHNIVAMYQGDANHAGGATGGVALTILRAPTVTTLVAAQEASTAGDVVAFTVIVIADPGVPTGIVELKDWETVIGTVPLDADGVAVFEAAAERVGWRPITATYRGDDNFEPSTSGPVSQEVAPAPWPDGGVADDGGVTPSPDGGTDPDDALGGDDCGCRISGSSRGGHKVVLIGLLILGVPMRRRRRR